MHDKSKGSSTLWGEFWTHNKSDSEKTENEWKEKNNEDDDDADDDGFGIIKAEVADEEIE
jgi:hypothetical protein